MRSSRPARAVRWPPSCAACSCLGGLNYELGRVREALEIYQQAWKRAGAGGRAVGAMGSRGARDDRHPGSRRRGVGARGRHGRHDRRVAAGAGGGPAARPSAWRSRRARATSVRCRASPRLRPWWQRDGFVAILSGAAAIELPRQCGDLDGATAVHADVVAGVSALWHRHGWQGRIRLNTLLLGHLASSVSHATGPERADLVRRRRRARRLDRRRGRRRRVPWAAARSGGRGLAGAGSSRACPAALARPGPTPAPRSRLLESWRRAVQAFESFGHVYETARSRARLAAVLRATGDTAGATAEIALAREVAVRLGAAPLLAELRALRRAQRTGAPGGCVRGTTSR